MPLNAMREFMRLEAAGGITLVAAAAVALVIANTGLGDFYRAFLDITIGVQIGALIISKPLLLWINDGLMAVFFFLVGLEIKREFMDGELSSPSQVVLPAVGAVGGMAVPAAIYVFLNWGNAENLNGWAIPAATDIGFALGVLALLGSRVPLPVKVLLTAVAVIDDLGAIIIIALFYTAQLEGEALIAAAVFVVAMIVLNRFKVMRIAPYILLAIALWICVLKSGVHATLAGVIAALTIPLKPKEPGGHSPLRHLEHELHPWSSFLVLPVFAFANAGVSFEGLSLNAFVEPVKLGISAGLFFGKQIGVFGMIFLAVAVGLAGKPKGTTWAQLYGASLLCGIGFTMSLFIGSLAFEHSDFDAPIRLGVLTGSVLSAVLGYLVLRFGSAEQVEAPVPA